MNRRGFLQALFAVPVIAAPLLLPRAVAAESPAWVVTEMNHDTGTVTLDDVDPGYMLCTFNGERWIITREKGKIKL